jgi:hypothetical protein
MNNEQIDLCKTCEHYWLDFPLPLDYYIPHCNIVDERIGYDKMKDAVPYPCLKCPFDNYSKKKYDDK